MREFDDIRPYEDSEVSGVLARLLEDEEFLQLIGHYQLPWPARWLPGVARWLISRALRQQVANVDSIAGFQDVVSHYASRVVRETTSVFHYEGLQQLDPERPCLFVSNHRDIATDSMLVNYALYLSGYDTVRIAVGDNLVQRQFATDLMRLNKSFFIKRSEKGTRRIYSALLESSRYIHKSLEEGHSIWIAQREGRAKDGWDKTDPAIIKMFALAGRKEDFPTVMGKLNIVPVAIAYEFDPCDQLKAKELKAIAEQGHYDKPPAEDLTSLAKGLSGWKGRVYLRFGRPLTGHYDSPEEVAAAIDDQILDNLQLYPVNYWALSRLTDSPYADVCAGISDQVAFDPSEAEAIEQRYRGCPADLREFWLQMYANPVVNKQRHGAARMAPAAS